VGERGDGGEYRLQRRRLSAMPGSIQAAKRVLARTTVVDAMRFGTDMASEDRAGHETEIATADRTVS
jgi:hypothetical protein